MEHGFDSMARVEQWIDAIRRSAIASMTPPDVLARELNATMQTIYRRMVERDGILRMHPGVSRFTLERVKPKLRAELDRRIMASANLIKLNREQAIDTTIRRFSGWATSIPAGGSDAASRTEAKTEVRKALAQLPFAERRVAIDQGHKLTSSLSNLLAVEGGAIAVVWNSHWRQAGYNYRPDHKERDGRVFAIRGSWALERGLMKAGPAGYYEDVTAFAEEPFCRCYGTYLYALRRLPGEMVTAKGRAEMERAAAERKAA
ncbi:MAG: hypothetical protein WDN25_13360 [Acetobacteraceae bacterium]